MKIIILEKKLDDYETHKDELIERFSNKIKELQECQKKNNNLESKIKHLKNTIKDNENHVSLCPPHLRSCYAAETNFLPNTSLVTEDDIKVICYYLFVTTNHNCIIN